MKSGMAVGASVVVFDVNQTLSDLGPMARRFADVGAPEHLAKLWFATLLRDGFALTAAGAQQPFSVLGDGALRAVLAGVGLDRGLDAAAEYVLSGFAALPVHADVADGIRTLRATGRRLVTLSNGSAHVAERLLADAGIRGDFDALLSVEDAEAWKPARAAYRYAAYVCGCDLADMMLVAAHPWDIDGAARAGMTTAWINRDDVAYPTYFTAPSITAASIPDLVGQLAG